MPGVKIQVSTAEAQTATEKLRRDLNALGAEAVMTERQMKQLEARMITKMGADKTSDAMNRLTTSLGLNAQEAALLSQKLGVTQSSLTNINTTAQSGIQQFGAFSGAIKGLIASFTGLYVVAEITKIFKDSFQAVEDYNQSIAALAAMVMTFTKQKPGQDFAAHWKESLDYSTEMIPILENLAAKTLLSGKETTALANAFARSGIFLDATNAKQIESFTRISNALPLMTQGQQIMQQINSEIRGLMTGRGEATSMMLTTMKAIDPLIESHLKKWREEGTVMENIGDLLVGFGPATLLLEKQWQAVKSTLDTIVTQILRGGMLEGYQLIIGSTQELIKYMTDHQTQIQNGLKLAWWEIQNVLGAVGGLLKGFIPIGKDFGDVVAVIAYGWGGVLAVLKPIGEFLGNSVALSYELVKMLGNGAVLLGALAARQFDVASVAWDEAKKGAKEIERLGNANKKILVEDTLDALTQYERKTKAAKEGDKTKAGKPNKYNLVSNIDLEDKDKTKAAMQSLREQWEAFQADMERDFNKYGVDEFSKKIEDLNNKEKDALQKFVAGKGKLAGKDLIPGAKEKITDFYNQERARAESDRIWAAETEMEKKREELQKHLTSMTASETEKRIFQVDDEVKKSKKIALDAYDLFDPEQDKQYREVLVKIDQNAVMQRTKIWEDFNKGKREMAIETQVFELDILEKQGLAHTETIDKRLALENQLLESQKKTLAVLELTKDTTAWRQQSKAIEETRKKIADLTREQIMKSPLGGATLALKDLANEYMNIGQQMYNATKSVFNGMTDSIVDFCMTSQFSFQNFANSVIKDLMRIAVQSSITGPLGSAIGSYLGNMFKSSGSTTTSTAPSAFSGASLQGAGQVQYFTPISGQHLGGMSSEPTFIRNMLSSDLAMARRRHTGVGPNEEVVIKEKNEGIFTQGQMKAMAPVGGAGKMDITINVHNEGGEKIQTTRQEATFDVQGVIIDMWIDGFTRNKNGLREMLGA